MFIKNIYIYIIIIILFLIKLVILYIVDLQYLNKVLQIQYLTIRHKNYNNLIYRKILIFILKKYLQEELDNIINHILNILK